METIITWANEFLSQLLLILLAYLLVVVAVLVDLRSGIRKAKERGEFRTSFGFRKTVKKVNEYGNTMMILTVLDFMQMLFFKVLNGQMAFHFPIIPLFTFIGAFGVGIIEYRSIKEKAFDKTKIEEIEQIVIRLARDRDLLNNVLGLLKHSDDEQQRFTQQQSGQYPPIQDQIQRGNPFDRPGV